MILSVSIGNTNIRCAVGTKHQNRHIDLPTETVCGSGDFIGLMEEHFGTGVWRNVHGSIVSSVVTDKAPFIIDAIWQKTNKLPKQIDLSRLNIDLSRYRGNLGEDRAVCGAAALSEYAPPIIVVDFGTATTVNFIDVKRRFLGGAIFVGAQTGLNALSARTSLLPRVSDLSNAAAIGSDTLECLVSGAIIGTANMIEGYIDRVGDDLGGVPTVIVTGGNAPFILPYCRFNYIHRPTLLIDELFSQYKLQPGG